MAQNSDVLISQLVGSLEPVKPLRFSHGMAYTLIAAALSTALVISLFGIRPDLEAARFVPMPLIAAGLYLGLGLASSVTVVMMSRPCVGVSNNGWTWAAAMAALLPIAVSAVSTNGTDLRL